MCSIISPSDRKKSVAVVQSSYIPWKGYFDLINMVDEFILFDDAQYTRRDWRNRNIIKTLNGLMWLSIPVEVKGKYSQKIKDTVISDPKWNLKHWKSILHNYSKAKYFHEYKDLFEKLYLDSNNKFLSIINYRFLSAICELLGIDTKISWSMDYQLVEGKTEKLVELCKQACAKKYISGPSAKKYINRQLFEKNGIVIKWMDYSDYPEYVQVHPPFRHEVSIVDLLMNIGVKNAKKYMLSFDIY